MAKKKELTEQQKKEIAILRNSNAMLNNSIKETVEKGKTDSMELIKVAKEENYQKMAMIDPELAKEEMMKENDKLQIAQEKYEDEDDMHIEDRQSSVYDKINQLNNDNNTDDDIEEEDDDDDSEYRDEENDEEDDDEINEETFTNTTEQVIDTSQILDGNKDSLQYDVVPLPSNGECYKNKLGRLKVAYLTAWSENLITSPHLYQDDLIIDALLKYQVLNKNINTDDLIQGDIDAIMLWLRFTGYGNEYPVHVKDPNSGEEFDTVADLSQLKTKEFTLKGDKNGWFDFTLPVTKANVKFKYLTRKEEKLLSNINRMESEDVKYDIIKKAYSQLKMAFKDENKLTKDEKRIISSSLDNMKVWVDKKPKETKINHVITNRLELMIQSINGNQDKQYISDFVRNMPSMDSLKLRRYVNDNEPGIDWNITVEKPESLGGGSFNLFLEWESNAFLNIA